MSTIYLNQAGTSWPKPLGVRTAASEFLQSDPATWPAQFQAARARVAQFFHIDDVSRMLLTPGCTSALSVAVTDHNWREGDRIVVSGLEHHSLHRAALNLQSRGVEIAVLPRGDREPMALEALENELDAGGVRLVALSAASNVTGELLPYRSAIALAKKYDALSLVDGAQIAGWWDLNLHELGADLFAFAGHKGPHAPWGIGGLYVAPSVELASPAAHCEVPADAMGRRKACGTMPGYCDVGSVDLAALAGLHAAVNWLSEPEQANRLKRARDRIAQFADGVQSLSGVRLLGNCDTQMRMPIVSLTVDGREPDDLGRALRTRNIVASYGLQCAPLAHRTLGTAPRGAIRFSAGPFTTEADIISAVEAVHSELLQQSASPLGN